MIEHTIEKTRDLRGLSASERLARLMEQVHLDIQLAGLEAQSLWEDRLRPEVESLHGSLRILSERRTRGARQPAQLGTLEAHELWADLEPYFSETLEAVKAAGRDPDGQQRAPERALRALLRAAKAMVHEATRDSRGARSVYGLYGERRPRAEMR